VLATFVVLISVGVTRSKPPTPPSASSDCDQTPTFLSGLSILKRCVKFRQRKLLFYLERSIIRGFSGRGFSTSKR
jgi:hypothetical protein